MYDEKCYDKKIFFKSVVSVSLLKSRQLYRCIYGKNTKTKKNISLISNLPKTHAKYHKIGRAVMEKYGHKYCTTRIYVLEDVDYGTRYYVCSDVHLNSY